MANLKLMLWDFEMIYVEYTYHTLVVQWKETKSVRLKVSIPD